MPTSPENNEQNAVQQAADQHADEILSRRREGRAKRAAALAAHPQPFSIRTEITQAPLAGVAGAVAPAPVPMTTQTAGYLLAVGDSWFDYPIHDILTRLDDNYGYNIESSAHRGDPIETMVSSVGQLDKFARCMDKIVALGAAPKAILISGGGDDIAGTEFGMLINNADLQPIAGWNDQVISGVIDTRIAAAYRMMILSVNSLCQKDLGRTFPILVHGYDYPVPDGRGFLGGGWILPGPWLKPGFDEKLFTVLSDTTQMMMTVIDRFNAMLQNLVQEPGFQNVKYIDLRRTLSNSLVELHAMVGERNPSQRRGHFRRPGWVGSRGCEVSGGTCDASLVVAPRSGAKFSRFSAKIAAFAAGFCFEANLANHDGFVERLGHVVDSECGDGGRSERFHFDAGWSDRGRSGRDAHAVRDELRLDIDVRERERMAHGNQLRGALGGLDACNARDFKRIAFGVRGQRGDDRSGKRNEGRSGCGAARGLLAADVDHGRWPDASKCESFAGLRSESGLGTRVLMAKEC